MKKTSIILASFSIIFFATYSSIAVYWKFQINIMYIDDAASFLFKEIQMDDDKEISKLDKNISKVLAVPNFKSNVRSSPYDFQIKLLDQISKEIENNDIPQLLENFVKINYALWRISVSKFAHTMTPASGVLFGKKQQKEDNAIQMIEKTQRWVTSSVKALQQIQQNLENAQ